MNQPSRVGAPQFGCGMRVDQRPGLPGVRQVMRFGAVEPGGRGRIFHPRMIRSGVVRHLVLNHLDAHAVRGIHQFAELGQRAEVLFHAVEIDRAVAVIIGDALVLVSLALIQAVDVVINRVDPEAVTPRSLRYGRWSMMPWKSPP